MHNNNNFFDVSDMRDDMIDLREDGVRKGEWVGFQSLYENYSMKKGSFSIFFATPSQGKSEFIKEMVLNTAEFSGWKWVVCSPETGSPKEVFAEYASGYLRKSFIKVNEEDNDKQLINCTDLEAERALNWMSEHIYVIDPGLCDMSVKGVYRELERLQREKGIKINGVVIDPYTEMAEEDPGLPIHKSVSGDLNTIRKNSSHLDLHTIVSVHTSKIDRNFIRDGKDLWYYNPEPTTGQLSFGQMWGRKGFMMVSIWRTPFDVPPLAQANGYERMQTQWNVQKAKPKSVGKEGKGFLYYDVATSRYYEKKRDYHGHVTKQFSYENPNKEVQQKNLF